MSPRAPSLTTLEKKAAGCTACPLWQRATQTVFGEGNPGAELMLVGEQPGDAEDVKGRPFVGPAGRLLDDALTQAGIERDELYITNVVKHFKWEARGKRRIHKKPNLDEIVACRPWLDGEIEAVRPRVIVALGATAAKALLGNEFKVTRDRGRFVELAEGRIVTATVHPSAIVRISDGAERKLETGRLAQDLAAAARAANGRHS